MGGVPHSACWTNPNAAWDQGDLIEGAYFSATDEKQPALLVTPACDIDHDKVEYWTLVSLVPEALVVDAITAATVRSWALGVGEEPSRRQRESLSQLLGTLTSQRIPRYHWLPIAYGEASGLVADFACVTSLPVAEVKSLRRFASLTSSWREQVPTRYAAYMGRIGTADFDQGDVDTVVARLVVVALATK